MADDFELPWEQFRASDDIPTECEICGIGEPAAIVVGEECLGWCQDCLDGAEENCDEIGELIF